MSNYDDECKHQILWRKVIKTLPNYPPHPPIPAFHHPEQVLHIPADYQLPEHSGNAVN